MLNTVKLTNVMFGVVVKYRGVLVAFIRGVETKDLRQVDVKKHIALKYDGIEKSEIQPLINDKIPELSAELFLK